MIAQDPTNQTKILGLQETEVFAIYDMFAFYLIVNSKILILRLLNINASNAGIFRNQIFLDGPI